MSPFAAIGSQAGAPLTGMPAHNPAKVATKAACTSETARADPNPIGTAESRQNGLPHGSRKPEPPMAK
jgi:hypothetical protein